MPYHLLVLQSSNPKVFCKSFEPMVVSLEICDRFFVHRLHKESFDNRAHIKDFVFFESTDCADSINLFFVMSNDERICNFARHVRMESALSRFITA